MIRNYYTLKRLAGEIHQAISEAKIIEIFSQSKDIVCIGLVTPAKQAMLLEISIEPQFGYSVVRSEYRRKQKNSVDLFQAVIGVKIDRVLMSDHDRILSVKLSGGFTLVTEFFGAMNVLLLDPDNKILDALHDSKTLKHQLYSDSARPILWKDFDDFYRRFQTVDNFKTALGQGLAQFNKFLALEFLWRLDADKQNNLEAAYNLMQTMLHELMVSKPRIYWIGDEPRVLSMVELIHLKARFPEMREELFDSVNKAVQVYTAKKATFERKKEMVSEFLKACNSRVRKNSMVLNKLKIEQDQSRRFTEYEQKGNLLNINIGKLRRGMSDVTVENVYSDSGESVTIELNPEKKPQENIERYFAQAKKLKNSVKKIAERIDFVNKENRMIQKLIETYSNEEKIDWKDFAKQYERFIELGWIKRNSAEPAKVETAPVFREFLVHGNWRV
ncbi:NFACT family protein, partial [bacterium]|nr:NFACT family protein [bacterium]